MKRKLNQRGMVLLLSLGLLLTASVGATVAYLLTGTGTLVNRFDVSRVACTVVQDGYTGQGDESIDVSEVENLRIRNTGDVDAYIRVRIVATWKNDDGVIYAQAPTTSDYTMTPDDPENWFRGSDGFWYFAKPVAPLEYTDLLIASCSLADTAVIPEGYHLSVEIIPSAIQATADAVNDWSDAVTAASDGAELNNS